MTSDITGSTGIETYVHFVSGGNGTTEEWEPLPQVHSSEGVLLEGTGSEGGVRFYRRVGTPRVVK